MTSRNYCFTINGENLEAFDPDVKEPLRYIVYQFEKCPTTNKVHIQGYLELSKPIRMAGVKKILGFNAHLESRKGTRDEARAYCMKEDTRISGPFEGGVWQDGGQGKRNDLAEVYNLLRSGTSDYDLLDANPATVIRNYRGLQYAKFTLSQRARNKRRIGLHVIVYHGQPGTGKTRRAHDLHEEKLFSLVKGNGTGVWFDGYGGEECLLIDDFYGWLPYGFLLQILDVYPLRLEIKGGHTWANWNTVIITSNKPWSEWYAREGQAALDRRIHCITYFGEDGIISNERGEEIKEKENSIEGETTSKEEIV